MNAVSNAIADIKLEIPSAILNHTFIKRENVSCQELINLDTRIAEKIIEGIVKKDLDIAGGTLAFIPLHAPVRSVQYDSYTVVYEIPAEMIENREIAQVYSLHFGLLGYQNTGIALTHNESPMSSAQRRVMDSAMEIPPAQTAYLNLIGPNTILCRFVMLPYTHAFMKVRLANDDAFMSLRPESYYAFSELCILAAKAYIFNELMLEIDQGQLSGGQNLGMFRETVAGFADARQMYTEARERFKAVSVFNDPERRRQHLRAIVPTR